MHSFFSSVVVGGGAVAILGSCNWMELHWVIFLSVCSAQAYEVDVCLYSTNATNIDMNLTVC